MNSLLTPLSEPNEDKKILCLCKCGNLAWVNVYKYRTRHTRSCGCLAKNNSIKHGRSRKKDPTYKAWVHIRYRCNNKNSSGYKYYGAKGIKLCDRWESFENFLADMGDRPSRQHSIDRIDPRGDYTPSNCRWLLKNRQNNNRSCVHVVEYKGVEYEGFEDLAKVCGIHENTLYKRYKAGWPIEKIVETPLRKMRNNRNR